MKNQIKLYPVPILRTFILSFFILTLSYTFLSAQEKVSKGLELIEKDRVNGIITDEEALVQKIYYGFNKSELDKKYSFENDIPVMCGTPVIMEYMQKKNVLSKSSVEKIESCIGRLKKRAFSESKYVSPSGKFELTYSTEGNNAICAVDKDKNGVPDFVERIASYFDYSWNYIVDTLGYHAPPIGEEKYKVVFILSEYAGFAFPIGNNQTSIAIMPFLDGIYDSVETGWGTIGTAKAVVFHEFMHACQYVYNKWNEPAWFFELHATWSEDIGCDDANRYYEYLPTSQICYPLEALTSGYFYNRCIFLHCLTQKFGVQIAREIYERIEKYSWEENLNTINSVLEKYNSSIKQIIPEYYSWCYLSGNNADSRLPSFEEAAYYPTSTLNMEISTLPYLIANTEKYNASAEFFRYNINETSGNLSIEFSSDNTNNTIVLITYFKDNSVDIKYYSDIAYKLIDTGYKLKDMDHIIIIPVNTDLVNYQSYTLSVDKYREVKFQHTPLSSMESILPKTVITNITVSNDSIDYSALKLNYKIGSGQFQTLTLLPTDNMNEYSSEIPGISDGDTISYYFSYYDSLRSLNNTLPLAAPDSLFSFMCGVDRISPIILHKPVKSLTKYDFPRRIFADISDNYNIASAYVEYNVNDKEMKRMDFVKYKDSVYYAPLFMDTTFCNNYDKISYRIVADDGAISNNTTIYPDSGFVNVFINPGYGYKSDFMLFGQIDTIYVKDDFSIKDLNIFLKATHIELDSILITLTSPSGKQVEFKKITSLKCDSLSVVFDDSAESSFASNDFFIPYNNYITGHYKPDNDCLNEFNGLNAKGEWIIQIDDLTWNNSYFCENWGLILQADQNISEIKEENEIGIPTEYSLSQNYPNPFNPTTTINYSLPKQSNVEIKIYDILGREVAVLVNEEKPAGTYEIHFDGKNIASGVYFCTMRSNSFIQTKKLVLVK
jgi:subtilisin-like proprotein convertase family protein